MSEVYRWKTTPYRHQVAAVKDLLQRGWGGALLMSPRTGKTKTTIDWFSILHQKGRVNRVLIICPVSVIGVWVNEIETHCPFPTRITVWDKKGRKQKKLPTLGRDILDIVIVNYDAFSTPPRRTKSGRANRRTGRFLVRDNLRKWRPQAMVLDESHRIKSPSAAKTTVIKSIAWKEHRPRGGQAWLEELVPYRVILTGTVLTKKKRVFDIYSQWGFLNPASPLVKDLTLKEFKEKYGVWTSRDGYPRWLRNRNEEALRKKLHKEAFAITRDECFDLPHRTDQVIPVPLEESGPYYDEMAAEMVANLQSGEISWAKIPLVQRLRLAQITSGIVKTEPTDAYPEGRLVRVGHEKLRALEELLADLFEAEEKVVIAARFRGDISAIVKICERLKVPAYELHGGISSTRSARGGESERDVEIRKFKQEQGAAAFIMQPNAGSLGIDLSTASIFIWFSLTNSWVDFTQAEDRVALSPRKTTFMYLIAEGTVDEIQLEALGEDGDVARRVTESPDRLLRNFKG